MKSLAKNKSEQLAAELCSHEQSLLIFANGYRRGPNSDGFIIKAEYPNTNNDVQPVDIYNYWEGMDTQFIERLHPRASVYVDGHYSLTTSNHLTIAQFASSMLTSEKATLPADLCYHNSACVHLNTTPNVQGFNERRSGGTIVGQRILARIKNGEYSLRMDNQGNVLDKVDIVCHSMGFAYALGIVDVLKQANIPLGRFYIFAPENACSGSVNINEWEEVWQYGSDEANDPLWLQDGVAPQCMPQGMTRVQRAFIPATETRGFLSSHLIENYEWIFNLNTNADGYVKPRQ
jgi:hypothetical protein